MDIQYLLFSDFPYLSITLLFNGQFFSLLMFTLMEDMAPLHWSGLQLLSELLDGHAVPTGLLDPRGPLLGPKQRERLEARLMRVASAAGSP